MADLDDAFLLLAPDASRYTTVAVVAVVAVDGARQVSLL